MGNKGWPHGPALTPDNKAWRYFSPSTLMAGDYGTSEGCLRRVYYEKVLKLRPEQSSWQTAGIELHAQNEQYLLTGDRSHMGSLALAGIHMLPKPYPIDPRIMVEHEIGGSLETAPLRAAGIPVAGYIDCIDWQGENAGASDVADTRDPEGTIQVLDHKTSSDPKWIKSAQEVSRTLQMTVYGKWAMITKNAKEVRLSHAYYITKGRHTPRKVSLRVHRDQIDERWEYVEHLASSLVEAVKEDSVDRVPANTKACGAFRGCPHRSYCSAASHNSLASIFGDDFASSLLGQDKPDVLTIEGSGTENMSLLAKLQAAQKPDATPAVAGPKPEVALEMKRLALEEVNIKYPGIADTIDKLEKVGLGLPTLLGEAARVYAIIKGAAPYAIGELAQFSFDDPAQLPVVLAEAQTIVAQRGTPVVAPNPVFPVDAPAPLASPPEVEKAPAPVITAEDAMAVAAGEKKKPGKKKKVDEAPVDYTPPAVGTPGTRSAGMESLTPDEVPYTGGKQINLFVDCIPSCKYESFWPYVTKVTDAITAKYGGVDYRAPEDNNGPTGFGKYKGFIAAGLRALASVGEIPPGNYLLDNAMTETGGVVVEAMREVVAASGGLLVRGIR